MGELEWKLLGVVFFLTVEPTRVISSYPLGVNVPSIACKLSLRSPIAESLEESFILSRILLYGISFLMNTLALQNLIKLEPDKVSRSFKTHPGPLTT